MSDGKPGRGKSNTSSSCCRSSASSPNKRPHCARNRFKDEELLSILNREDLCSLQRNLLITESLCFLLSLLHSSHISPCYRPRCVCCCSELLHSTRREAVTSCRLLHLVGHRHVEQMSRHTVVWWPRSSTLHQVSTSASRVSTSLTRSLFGLCEFVY